MIPIRGGILFSHAEMSRADSIGHETLVQCLSSFNTLGGTRSSDILQDLDCFSWGLKFTTSKNVNDAFLG